MADRIDLQRFVDAQDGGGTYDRALRELRSGRKQSHWMWFVFPQVVGLGRSEMAQRFALAGVDEARALLAHPVLGGRLVECAQVLLALPDPDAVAVFGPLDALKLRSSMTLFAAADPAQQVFADVLETFFGGVRDTGTTSRL